MPKNTPTSEAPENREAWLHALAFKCADHLRTTAGLRVNLSKVRLSCGWPGGGRSQPGPTGSGHRVGECWHAETNKSGLHEIFISPLYDTIIKDDGRGVGEVVIHELIHAALPANRENGRPMGHTAGFAKAAKAAGLDGKDSKPTATTAGEDLIAKLKQWGEDLGPYPHSAMDGKQWRRQPTRLLKVWCPATDGCGYTTRVTQTWIDDGCPICPNCYEHMVLAGTGRDQADGADTLTTIESHQVYEVKNPEGKVDARWQVRCTRKGKDAKWTVIDYGESTIEVDGKQMVNLNSTPRITAVEGRNNAMETIDAIREGYMTYTEIDNEAHTDEDPDWFDDSPDEFNEADAFEDDETADHPEDQDPGSWVHPISGKVIRFEYDEVAASRE